MVREIMIGQSARERKATMQALAITKRRLLLVARPFCCPQKTPAAERPYRTWGYPVVPIISIFVAALLIVDLAFLAPGTSGIGILIVLTGVPVYFLWRKSAAS